MKVKLIFALFILVFNVHFQSVRFSGRLYAGEETYKWVSAKTSLNVRTEPQIDSTVSAMLSFGTKVKVIDRSEKKDTVNVSGGKLTDYWYKICYSKCYQNGWVFGAYLADLTRLKKITDTWVEKDKEFIADQSLKDSKETAIKIILTYAGGEMMPSQFIFYENGL